MLTNRKTVATLIGYSSLLIWAISAVLVTHTRSLPLFEMLAIVYFISFSLSATLLSLRKRWHLVKQPPLIWLIGVLGVYGNEIFYLASFRFAPPVQADLINYLWPIFAVVFYHLFAKEQFNRKHLIAITVGFCGIYLLLTNGKGWTGFKMEYLPGYTLAFAAAMIWSGYIVLMRIIKSIPIEMTGMYYGIGMLCSLLLHLRFEHTIMPTHSQILCLILMGLTSQGVAYFFWNYGVRHGNFQLLTILSYSNPIISVACLYMIGFANLTITILIACLLVCGACLIGFLASPKTSPA